MITRALVLILLGFGLAACGTDPAPEVNWGPWRVQITEHWPGAEAGYDWGKLPAGIGLWRAKAVNGFTDYAMGWMAEGDEGYGVAGLLEGDLGMESRLEVSSFGAGGIGFCW